MEAVSKKWHPHTMAQTFERVLNQEDPWNAIGDFLDDWRHISVEDRLELVHASISPTDSPELHKWATFCAAAVEYLCKQDGLSTPEWVHNRIYRMKHPWFLYKNWHLRVWQLVTTPVPFRTRNIFGGDRILERV